MPAPPEVWPSPPPSGPRVRLRWSQSRWAQARAPLRSPEARPARASGPPRARPRSGAGPEERGRAPPKSAARAAPRGRARRRPRLRRGRINASGAAQTTGDRLLVRGASQTAGVAVRRAAAIASVIDLASSAMTSGSSGPVMMPARFKVPWTRSTENPRPQRTERQERVREVSDRRVALRRNPSRASSRSRARAARAPRAARRGSRAERRCRS